jgi:hypothetical protein
MAVALRRRTRFAAWDGRRARRDAESARGLSARAAHRSGLDTLASSGSCHQTKAAAFRRKLGLLLLPVGPLSTLVTCPLCSTGVTPLHHYYEAVRPCPNASVLSASRVHRLCLFPWHRWPGSQVPCESLNESHASYTPDTAWPVSRFLPYFSRGSGETPVLMSSGAFRCFNRGSLALVSLIHTWRDQRPAF